MELKEALEQLDTMDDDLWTANGAPRVDTLQSITGNDELSRQDIVNAAPQFSRENPIVVITQADDEEEVDIEEIDEEDTTIDASEEDEISTDEEVEEVESIEEIDASEEDEISTDEEVEEVESLTYDAEYLRSGNVLPDEQQFSAILLEITDSEKLTTSFEELKAEEAYLHGSIKGIQERATKIAHLALLAQKRRDFVDPPLSEQEQRMLYIRKQGEIRAGKKAALGNVDLSLLAKLDPRAPIDRVMAAKRKRQDQRPIKV